MCTEHLPPGGYPIAVKYIYHHKHPGLGHLARSVFRVTVSLSIVSSVSRLFSFLVGCSEMILKGFGFVAFFAGVKVSSFCIHPSVKVIPERIVNQVITRTVTYL
jgi:hypothetical protein